LRTGNEYYTFCIMKFCDLYIRLPGFSLRSELDNDKPEASSPDT